MPTCHCCDAPAVVLVRTNQGLLIEVCNTHNLGDVELVTTIRKGAA